MRETNQDWLDNKKHYRGKSQNHDIEDKNKIKFKLGELDDALKQAQNLLDNKPQNENYLYLKGRVLEKLDRLEDAES